ncbi:uncharacterized protein C2orf92 homolog [Suricata suricatta]|uniref:uncharacterized protein C2orf92 homolog n=1 Tax=Suricata suricatta TaxID=37032 RepID=UPI0011557D84|nr:uncharacterized protein C2orf92 homolog [Suricata suricatta]
MRGAETLFFVLFLDCWQASNTEFSSSSKNLDEDLAKIFDEILQQVFSKVPYETPFDKTRTASKSITKRETREDFIKEDSVAGYSTKPGFLLGSVDRMSTHGHISEKRNKKSSLFNSDINEQPANEDKETLQEAVKTDTQNKDVPCAQLLGFLQRNITTTAASVAGILLVTLFLLLVLTACIRRKRPLYPPATITYNIFMLNGKTWWQKYQEKNPRKQEGKEKQLKSKSCI